MSHVQDAKIGHLSPKPSSIRMEPNFLEACLGASSGVWSLTIRSVADLILDSFFNSWPAATATLMGSRFRTRLASKKACESYLNLTISPAIQNHIDLRMFSSTNRYYRIVKGCVKQTGLICGMEDYILCTPRKKLTSILARCMLKQACSRCFCDIKNNQQKKTQALLIRVAVSSFHILILGRTQGNLLLVPALHLIFV